MKTKILFIIIAFTSFCNAQIINIPDANFKAKLIALGVDTNSDGNIQISEALVRTSLNVSNSSISSLIGIESFTNLTTLYCSSNQLQSLNLTGLTQLYILECQNNLLTTLDASSSSYYLTLKCYNNQLSSLIIGQTVQTLECQNNNLTNINFSNSQINSFNCSNNQLTSLLLGNFGLGLGNLNCSNNLLTSLNVSNLTSLVNFNCSNNNLTSLNLNGLNILNDLGCANNQLTSLSMNGLTNLTSLGCSNNQLTVLNLNGLTNLNYINCDYNQLTTIDCSLLTNLYSLACGNNPLSSIFVKNGRNESFNLDNIPTLQYICADESQISSIQNILTNNGFSYPNCNVNSYCTFTPGGTFYTINGNEKFDINNNGCDLNDIIIPNFKINISSNLFNGSIFANTSGNYSIPVQSGTYTLTPIVENSAYFNISPVSSIISFPSVISPFIQNYCVSSNGNHNDLEIVLIPINQARPGFDAYYKLIFKNKGTTTQSGSANFTFDDNVLDIVSSIPNVSNQSTGNMTWNFTNLLPFESREIDIVLNLNSPIETPALNSGDILNYTSSINGQTDETPNDNISNLNQTVVNSYDPNDKTCLEGTTITPSMVGEYVHYLIRFENNGTANAQNIVVKDMIDINKFDINTLIPIKGSHNFETRISSTNKVEFIFQNINLPFDDANNDGYVSFKIKTKPNLVVGNTFSNSANIYFDYNFPIVTNNYTTTIQNSLGIQENNSINKISLYPNPVKDILNFKTEHNISKVEVYDIAGRILSSNSISENKINLSDLKTGNYILKLYTEKGIMNTKIIKE